MWLLFLLSEVLVGIVTFYICYKRSKKQMFYIINLSFSIAMILVSIICIAFAHLDLITNQLLGIHITLTAIYSIVLGICLVVFLMKVRSERARITQIGDTVLDENKRREPHTNWFFSFRKSKLFPLCAILFSTSVIMLTASVVSAIDSIKNDSNANTNNEYITNELDTYSSYSEVPSLKSKEDIIKEQIENHLTDCGGLAAEYDKVYVYDISSELSVSVFTDSYEKYTLAAITKATMEIMQDILDEFEVEKYIIMTCTPTENKFNASWTLCDNYNGKGIFIDNRFSGRTEENLTAEELYNMYNHDTPAPQSTNPIETTKATAAEIKQPEDNNSESNITSTPSTTTPSSASSSSPAATTATTTKATTTATTTTIDYSSHEVCIAASGNGSKYHRSSSCSKMNGNVIWMSREQAKGLGYTACKKCYG